MTYQPRPEDFSLKYSDEFEVYPFYEDEDGCITGYGHQEPVKFAKEIVRYDVETGEAHDTSIEEYLPHIYHEWALMVDEHLRRVVSTCPGALPITTLWGYR